MKNLSVGLTIYQKCQGDILVGSFSIPCYQTSPGLLKYHLPVIKVPEENQVVEFR